MNQAEIENIEIDLLLDALFRKYGYDFRSYSRASVKRRIMKLMDKIGINRVTDLIHSALRDQEVFEIILRALSINVTEMFRDPTFFLAVRRTVIPLLKTRDFIKVWHAGCATGEEAYSMAILLKEAGLLKRCQIYATDMNKIVLNSARNGIYPLDRIKEYTTNYQRAGGEYSFGDYYTARYDSVILEKSLKTSIVFADHNLTTDGVFGEMDMIVCRNVLIYFNRELQDRVLGLFVNSLTPGGILCLGSKESISFSAHSADFEAMVEREKIYRKHGGGL
ncbi:MAG: protein-glutamate O-methyltransferase CheR [Deltaproteobacteria bacterium]|nr:protein-glutamate O-methyltransferase CheR [Deltaproteobacteria bacterium]